MALINNSSYTSLLSNIGIDIAVRDAVVNSNIVARDYENRGIKYSFKQSSRCI